MNSACSNLILALINHKSLFFVTIRNCLDKDLVVLLHESMFIEQTKWQKI